MKCHFATLCPRFIALVAGVSFVLVHGTASADPPKVAVDNADIHIKSALATEMPWEGGVRVKLFPEAKNKRTFFVPPVFLFSKSSDRPVATRNGTQLRASVVLFPPGLNAKAAEWLTDHFKDDPNRLEFFAKNLPVKVGDIQRLPMRSIRMRLEGLSGVARPADFTLPGPGSPGNILDPLDIIDARWEFNSEAAAEAAREQFEAGKVDVSIDYAFIGVQTRGVKVEVTSTDLKASEWSNDVRPNGRGLDDPKQYFTLEQIGRSMKDASKRAEIRIQRDDGVRFSFELKILEMAEELIRKAMEQSPGFDSYPESEDIYVGKDSFNPNKITESLEKMNTNYKSDFSQFVEGIKKTDDYAQYISKFESLDKNLRRHKASGHWNSEAAIDVIKLFNGRGKTSVGGQSDYLKQSYDFLQRTNESEWRKKYEEEFRSSIASSLEQSLSTETVKKGEFIEPKRIKVYRVNATKYSVVTSLGYQEIELVLAGQVVSTARKVENTDKVVGSAYDDIMNQIRGLKAKADSKPTVLTTGYIDLDRSIKRQSGLKFKVATNSSEGVYEVSYDAPLKRVPVVIATSDNGPKGVAAFVAHNDKSGFKVECRRYSDNGLSPAAFGFIVVDVD